VATIHASDAFLEAQQMLAETGERQRRDLLEELLAGGYPSGARLIVAVESGLLPAARLVVVSARVTNSDTDEESMRVAAGSLVRATRAPVLPLAVVRRDEVVIVLPVRPGVETDLVGWIAEAQRTLAEHELVLSIGISTVRPDVSGVADAYREATDARERLGADGGVLGLPALSALDYVAAVNQQGLRRLISENVRRFIDEDLERGGTLIDTLHAYTTTSLNVARTAEMLGIHVNTAHYRIGRIAERTGLDLRSVEDVMELVLAIRSLDVTTKHHVP
jgi:sugar diacid utilization regulator